MFRGGCFLWEGDPGQMELFCAYQSVGTRFTALPGMSCGERRRHLALSPLSCLALTCCVVFSACVILISLGESVASIPVEQMGKWRLGEANQLPKVLLAIIMAEESLKRRFFSSRSALPVSLSPTQKKGDTVVVGAAADGPPSHHLFLWVEIKPL